MQFYLPIKLSPSWATGLIIPIYLNHAYRSPRRVTRDELRQIVSLLCIIDGLGCEGIIESDWQSLCFAYCLERMISNLSDNLRVYWYFGKRV